VARWKLVIWKPLEEDARGRYLTYEVYTDKKYKVFQRYIRVETLRKIYDVVRDAIEEIVLNEKRDSEKIERKFNKKVIDIEI
jgi:hypothetical protein